MAAVAMVAALCACAGRADPERGPSFAGWSSERHIRIEILNNNFQDVTLWLIVREAARQRLGTVTGKTHEVFVVPWEFNQPLRLEVDLLAGPRCRTRALDVDPGDILQLEILPVFRESEWCTPG